MEIPAIRNILTVLVVLVLAAAAVVGAYGLLLAANRGAVVTSPPAPPLELPPPIPEIERLPRAPSAQPASVSRDKELVRETGSALVLVTGAGPGSEALGVALLEGQGGAPIAWMPLAEGERTADGVLLRFDRVPVGEHLACLSTGIDRARYSYLSRVPLKVEADGEGPRVELQARIQDVAVTPELPGREQGTGPPLFRLERVDDAHWHAPLPPVEVREVPMTAMDERGVLSLRHLGAGTYRLTVLGGGYEPVEFAVPGPAELTARFRR